MMQPADLRDGNHVSLRRRFDRTRKRRVPHQRQMRSRFVVVGSVTHQDPPQVILAEDDEMVGALAPDGADHAFGVRVLPRGLTSCNDLLESDVPHSPTEEHAVDRVSIPKQKSRFRAVGGERLDDLLSSPLGRRMRRHFETTVSGFTKMR